MPYTDHNINISRPFPRRTWLFQNSQWVRQMDSSYSVNTVSDRVYLATKRPEPKGFKPPSAYNRVRVHIRPSPDAFMNEWMADGRPYAYHSGAVDTHIIGSTPFPPEVPSGIRTSMHFDVLDRVKNQSMDLGVALAEVPKTARLIGQSARTIARSIQLARRNRWDDAAYTLGLNDKLFKDISKRWLTLKYGWTPIMMDVQAGCSVLSNGLGDMRYGATSTRSYPLEQPIVSTGHSVRRVGTRKLKLRLDFQIDNNKFQSFGQLGLTNPASIAWELVPFSFVADWFMPIGDWLSALDIAAFATFKGGTFTDYYNYTDIHESYTNVVNGVLRQRGIYGHKKNVVSVNRSVISSYLPTIIPKPDFSLSLSQMASGLSLLQEVVVRGKR